MKFVISICMAMMALLQAGQLEFSELLKEMKAPVDAKSITAEFEFTNRSDKIVKVSKIEPGCSCMTASIKDDKLSYGPGESGVVRATFDLRNYTGVVDKSVALWLDDAPISQPSLWLTMRVSIPVLVEIEPKTVKWEVAGKIEPKSIRISMKHDKPIRVMSVETSTDSFKYEMKTIEEGKVYELVVTPVALDSPNLGIFRITTDCEIEKFKEQQAFGVVHKP